MYTSEPKINGVKMNERPMLLSPTDAARLLGCGRTHLYGMLNRGELRSILVGRLRRIPRTEIEAYIQRQMEEQQQR